MRVNRLSSAVRIQSDRGQRVISDGPYRFMRHPGYAAALDVILVNGMALSSNSVPAPRRDQLDWCAHPVVAHGEGRPDVARRTARYMEYAARVKWRLLPGVW
jgi:protein-S-isoprenylcysteine O-methyltransferase Ste14